MADRRVAAGGQVQAAGAGAEPFDLMAQGGEVADAGFEVGGVGWRAGDGCGRVPR